MSVPRNHRPIAVVVCHRAGKVELERVRINLNEENVFNSSILISIVNLDLVGLQSRVLVDGYAVLVPRELRVPSDLCHDLVGIVDGGVLIADGFHELRGPREGERALGLGLAEVVGQDGLVLSGVVGRHLVDDEGDGLGVRVDELETTVVYGERLAVLAPLDVWPRVASHLDLGLSLSGV